MTFSEKLTILRKRRGLSQEQLAEMLDVSRQSVSKWEAQQALPETSKIIMIGEIFNVSIDLLLKNEESIEIEDVPKTVSTPHPKRASVNTSPAPNTTNVQPLGMAWYKFLIYFSLIAGAIINLIYSFNYISGGIYFVETNGEVFAEQVYAYYGTGLQVVDVFYGFFLIAFAILAFVVRHKLANYEPDSIKLVKIFYSLSAGVPLLYAILVTAITGQSLAVQAVTSAIFGLVFLLLNIKYFKKRAHLFVEKTAVIQSAKPPAISPVENIQQETINEPSPVIHTLNHTETIKKTKKKPIIIVIVSSVVVLLITVLIILLVGNKGNDVQSNGNSLVVAVEPDFYPYSWEENGKFYGLHVDIAKEMAKRNGFSVEFISANWEDLFVGIENGTYNLVLGVEPTEYRQEAFSGTASNFTDVYYDGMAAIFNVKEFELTFSEWSNFKFTIKEMVEDGTIEAYLTKYDLKF